MVGGVAEIAWDWPLAPAESAPVFMTIAFIWVLISKLTKLAVSAFAARAANGSAWAVGKRPEGGVLPPGFVKTCAFEVCEFSGEVFGIAPKLTIALPFTAFI